MKLNRCVWNWRIVRLLGMVLVAGTAFTGIQAAPVVITEVADFSDNMSVPTDVTPELGIGTNIIRGSVDGHIFGTDHDYFRITIPVESHVSGMFLVVSNYSSPIASSGFFDVFPVEEGNSGGVTIVGNATQAVPFLIQSPTNIILHAVAPFISEPGLQTSYDYEVQLIVSPVEFVAGTAIHKAVEITFPSEAGRHYQLQYTSDMASEVWTNVGDPMQGTGETMSAFDTTRLDSQRFYRVMKQ